MRLSLLGISGLLKIFTHDLNMLQKRHSALMQIGEREREIKSFCFWKLPTKANDNSN